MGLFKKTKIEEIVDQMTEAQRAEAAKRAEQLTDIYGHIISNPVRAEAQPTSSPTAADFYYGTDTSPTYKPYDFTSRPTISQSTSAAIERMIDQKLEHLTTNTELQAQVNKLAVEIRLVREMLDNRVSSNELVELRTLLENTIGGMELRIQEMEEDLYGA